MPSRVRGYSLLTLLAAAVAAWPSPGAQAAPVFQSIYQFKGGADGAQPQGALVADRAGNLYGTTCCTYTPDPGPEDNPWGTVYRLSPPAPGETKWKKTIIYAFKSFNDGFGPDSALRIDESTGRVLLFGTTAGGGRNGGDCLQGCGTVFSLRAPAAEGGLWVKRTLYRFKGGADGHYPGGQLVVAPDGKIFGATTAGGVKGPMDNGNGTVFQLEQTDPNIWTKTTVHQFTGLAQAVAPVGGLIRDNQGNLYGASTYGGVTAPLAFLGQGTVFKLSPPAMPGGAWAFNRLHAFQGGADGMAPRGGLIFGDANILYGTTQAGGGAAGCPNGCGTIFSLSSPDGIDWYKTVLHSFVGGTQGDYPQGGLMRFGSSLFGATSGMSQTVFRLDPPVVPGSSWYQTTLHNFNGDDGAHPNTTLVRVGKYFYGVTLQGGTSPKCKEATGCGTIFRIKP